MSVHSEMRNLSTTFKRQKRLPQIRGFVIFSRDLSNLAVSFGIVVESNRQTNQRLFFKRVSTGSGIQAMHYLVIKNGKNAGKRISFPPHGEILIGRGPECQLRLASTDVSRKHCRLKLQGGGVTVEDLGSQNGTFLDGFLIQALVQLRPESVLRVGTMEFQVKRAKSGKSESAKPIAKEDDIAAWLTEEGETDEVNLDDSTIVPKNSSAQKPQEPPPGQISLHPDSETAAEIIQQHWKAKFQS